MSSLNPLTQIYNYFMKPGTPAAPQPTSAAPEISPAAASYGQDFNANAFINAPKAHGNIYSYSQPSNAAESIAKHNRPGTRLSINENGQIVANYFNGYHKVPLTFETQWKITALIRNFFAWICPNFIAAFCPRLFSGSAEITVKKHTYYVARNEIMNTVHCDKNHACHKQTAKANALVLRRLTTKHFTTPNAP